MPSELITPLDPINQYRFDTFKALGFSSRESRKLALAVLDGLPLYSGTVEDSLAHGATREQALRIYT
jgi:hypothetical protein